MSILIDVLILFGSVMLHADLFYVAFRFGAKHEPRPGVWRKLALKILSNKKRLLDKNPAIKAFSRYAEKGKTTLAVAIIAPLIFIKSVMMILAGYFAFIALIVIPMQGALMREIMKELKAKGMELEDLTRTVQRQLISMLLTVALGSLGAYHWFMETTDEERSHLPYLAAIFLAGSLIYAVLAARSEVTTFQKHKTVLS